MKRLFFVASLLMALTAAEAAPKHTFYFLVGQQQVNVEFNYDKVRFEIGMSPTELSSFRKAYEGTWESLFVRELNEELQEVHLTAHQHAKTDYTIRVTPTKATQYGFLRATVSFLDKNGAVVKTVDIRTDKDHHYSLTESYIDSMKELGEELGDLMEEGM